MQKDAPDIILRACYGTWYMMSDLGSRLTTGKHMMPDPFENSGPLVEVPILLPRGVNADLLVVRHGDMSAAPTHQSRLAMQVARSSVEVPQSLDRGERRGASEYEPATIGRVC